MPIQCQNGEEVFITYFMYDLKKIESDPSYYYDLEKCLIKKTFDGINVQQKDTYRLTIDYLKLRQLLF